jgi:hypothetical protein
MAAKRSLAVTVANLKAAKVAEGWPSLECEPSLEMWLQGHKAERVWETYSKAQIRGVPAMLIACYRFPIGRSALVTVAAHGAGWDIATSCGGDDIDHVLYDAECRLRLAHLG